MKKTISTVFLLVGAVFFFTGALFAGIGGFFFYDNIKFKESAETCEALITEIEVYRDSDGDTYHNVFVRYEIDGHVYDEELNYYTADMSEGDVITLYYDPANPSKTVVDGGNFLFIVFIGLGSVFAIMGLCFLIKAIKDKRMVKRVIAMNCIIQAQIGDFSIDGSLMVNGRHPFVLRASAISPYDGQAYEFRSDAIWNDLRPILQAYNITKVPVYVNPQNYKEYYMDMTNINQYLGNGVK